jgi:uncharacterized protein (TIGR02246 family)
MMFGHCSRSTVAWYSSRNSQHLSPTRAAVVLLAVALIAGPTRAQRAPLSVIARADSEWLGAMRAHDAEKIAAPYATDGMFVSAAGVVTRGRDSIAALYRRRFGTIVHILDGGIDREGLQAVTDTLVYEWGHGRLTFTDSAGARHSFRGPYLTVWRREPDGAWRIIRNLVF